MGNPRANGDVVMSDEYTLVREFYKGKRGERSGVPYLQHIDEGLYILECLGASRETLRAFAIHPLVQGDQEFQDHVDNEVVTKLLYAGGQSGAAMALALEYRYRANSYTSRMPPSVFDSYKRSPLPEVNLMLLADKIQNYKDAILYVIPKMDFPEANRLHTYFQNWMDFYEISDKELWFWIDNLKKIFPLNHDADNLSDVADYYTARVATMMGYHLKNLREVEGGVEATITSTGPYPRTYLSYYLYKSRRGRGLYKAWVHKNIQDPEFQIVTTNSCNLKDMFDHWIENRTFRNLRYKIVH